MSSELERKRLENIRRNQQAIRQFHLEELSQATFGDPEPRPKPKPRPRPKRRRDWSKPPEEPRAPRHRLRRLGVTNDEEDATIQQEAVKREEEERERQEAERTRREGELKLPELVGDGKWNQALEIISGFGGKVSQGDLFDDIKITDKHVESLRHELNESLILDQRDVKATQERIMAIAMHPSITKKLVLAGDKNGELGLWDPSINSSKTDNDDDDDNNESDEHNVISFRNHTRAIATITADFDDGNKVYTGSYDGSIRLLDLAQQKSTDVFVFDAPPATPRDPVGISDFSLVNPHTIYYTTLDGRFGVCDLRAPPPRKCEPKELHEKKIGGFAVNPLNDAQIATASLDRTLKVWDIRGNSHGRLCAEYESRLSVSNASWNTSGQIVCNGYDNTINVFNLGSSWAPSPKQEQPLELQPDIRLQHNCQTGRWVSILKAHWQARPRDGIQKFVIANMKRYTDVYAGTGQQLAHLAGDIVTAVPAVVQFHPTENWIAGGTSSGKIYLYT